MKSGNKKKAIIIAIIVVLVGIIAIVSWKHICETADGENMPIYTVDESQDALDIPVGSRLTEKQVKQLGEDSLFRVMRISDKVFARMQGRSYTEKCPVKREQLRYLRLLHKDASGNILVGEMVCHASIAEEVSDIFKELYHQGYPIEKMRLIDDYNASDSASMADNNTSAFNCRVKTGGKILSRHAYGMAIDINPLYNPYVKKLPKHLTIEPVQGKRYAERDTVTPYTVSKDDACYKAFIDRKFRWGGEWKGMAKDYQHFETTPFQHVKIHKSKIQPTKK